MLRQYEYCYGIEFAAGFSCDRSDCANQAPSPNLVVLDCQKERPQIDPVWRALHDYADITVFPQESSGLKGCV